MVTDQLLSTPRPPINSSAGLGHRSTPQQASATIPINSSAGLGHRSTPQQAAVTVPINSTAGLGHRSAPQQASDTDQLLSSPRTSVNSSAVLGQRSTPQQAAVTVPINSSARLRHQSAPQQASDIDQHLSSGRSLLRWNSGCVDCCRSLNTAGWLARTDGSVVLSEAALWRLHPSVGCFWFIRPTLWFLVHQTHPLVSGSSNPPYPPDAHRSISQLNTELSDSVSRLSTGSALTAGSNTCAPPPVAGGTMRTCDWLQLYPALTPPPSTPSMQSLQLRPSAPLGTVGELMASSSLDAQRE